MGNDVLVTEEGLKALRDALEQSGEDYKAALTRLTALIQEITKGDIQGDPANDLLAKYNEKEEIFKKLAETIDDAEEYMGMQNQKFGSMISDLASGMR